MDLFAAVAPPRRPGHFVAPPVLLGWLAVSCVLAAPGLAAQDTAPLPPQGYRDGMELIVLASPAAAPITPDARLTYQRRLTLKLAATASALVLNDPLSHAAGVVVGGSVAVPLGPLLLEPFAEAGGGWADARIPDGSYEVVAGSERRTFERYLAATGMAELYGVGLSVGGLVGRRLAGRVTLGWWHGTVGAAEMGGLRIGVGLGWARPDRRWYQHRTDETPPTIAVSGEGTVDGHAIEVSERRGLRIVARDASGIARITTGDGDLTYRRLPRDPKTASTPGEAAVEAELPVRPGPGGEVLTIVAIDSGGLAATERVHVVGPPDRTDPAVEVLPPAHADDPWREVRVSAWDASGIVDGLVGRCPVRPVPVGPRVRGEPTRWLLRAAWPSRDRAVVLVRDQAGNETRVEAEPPSIQGDPTATPPEVSATAEVTSVAGNARSVRVHGVVTDPQGLEVVRVTVDGMPAALLDGPEGTRFDGWLVATGADSALVVDVLTIDGRRSTTRIPIAEGGPARPGRLHALVISADTDPPIAALEPALNGEVITAIGPGLGAREVQDAILEAAAAVGPDDVLLVHLSGTLIGPQVRAALEVGSLGGRLTVARPGVRLEPLLALSRGTLDLREIGDLLGTVQGLTLVAADFRTTRSWGAVPRQVPGALPPPGCTTSDRERRSRLVDIRGARLDRIARALRPTGPASEGVLRAGDFVEALDALPEGGLLPFDPLMVIRPGVEP